MSDDDRFVSLNFAAEKLGVCVRTLRRLAERGDIPKLVKVGASSRLPLSELLDYMNRLKAAR